MKSIKIKEIKTPTALKEDHNVEEIDIIEMIPNVMGKVVIFERDGEHVLDIPSSMDGMAWKQWLQTPAGVFSKDFLRWMRDKDNSEYMLVKGETLKSVVRLIKPEELEEFEVRKLVHGKLKDIYYMHLKTLALDDNIHGTQTYIHPENLGDSKIKEDDEKDLESLKSESLFD